MANIRVMWFRYAGVDSITPELLAKYSGTYTIARDMGACKHVGRDTEYYTLEFAPTPHVDLLLVTRQIIEDIRYQAHPMSGFGHVEPFRKFVPSKEEETGIDQMNETLTALDNTLDSLKESEGWRKRAKESVKISAQTLKETRSIFGSKAIASVRRSLEAIAAN